MHLLQLLAQGPLGPPEVVGDEGEEGAAGEEPMTLAISASLPFFSASSAAMSFRKSAFLLGGDGGDGGGGAASNRHTRFVSLQSLALMNPG